MLLRMRILVNAEQPGEVNTYHMLCECDDTYTLVTRTDLLRQTAHAQEQVSRLLQAALQQQQQQQGQSASQDAAQQLAGLQSLAQGLLSFWLAVDGLWALDNGDDKPDEALTAQKDALGLAAVLAPTLTADSPHGLMHVLASVTNR
jgi:multidrug efflux pump subunit AcrA (membrane-fusion protein)